MSESRSTGPKRILFVDDEDAVRDAVRMLLSMDGHLVEAVNSGPAALEKFEPGRFDLVITDFCMPEMTGDELAQALKCRSSELPIILLTAFPPETTPPGIDLVVTKPFQLDNLRRAMVDVCS